MKKVLLLAILSIALIGTSCKKYIATQMVTYKAYGNGAYLVIHSNTEHRDIQVNLDDHDYTYQEVVNTGDTIDVFMMRSYQYKPYSNELVQSHVQVFLGTHLLGEGTPDSTGIVSLRAVLGKEDFRLKYVK